MFLESEGPLNASLEWQQLQPLQGSFLDGAVRLPKQLIGARTPSPFCVRVALGGELAQTLAVQNAASERGRQERHGAAAAAATCSSARKCRAGALHPHPHRVGAVHQGRGRSAAPLQGAAAIRAERACRAAAPGRGRDLAQGTTLRCCLLQSTRSSGCPSRAQRQRCGAGRGAAAGGATGAGGRGVQKGQLP